MFHRFTLWMQTYYPWIVGTLALVCVLSYSMQPLDLQEQPQSEACFHFFLLCEDFYKAVLRFISTLSGLLAAATGLAWFAFAFASDNPEIRRIDQVRFAYFFVASSFAILMLPPFLKSQAIGSEPLGIVSGCVDNTDVEQIACFSKELVDPTVTDKNVQQSNAAGAAGNVNREERNQWLVNIGGALIEQDKDCKKKFSQDSCKPGSNRNRVKITGGIVIPLPFLIIALFGGAISLSRRVPEIQKRSEKGFIGTPNELPLNAGEAREQLAFQILQFISAPLIAIVAHHVIEPTGRASGIALAFMAGFGSETILLIIRGVATGIAPRSVTIRSDTGAVFGTVVDADKLVTGAEVKIGTGGLQTITDVNGQFQFAGVPAGPVKVTAGLESRTGTVDVQVIAGQTANCIVSLDRPFGLLTPTAPPPPPLP